MAPGGIVFYRDACRCLHGEGWKIARTTCQEESSSTRRSAPAPAFEMRAHRFLRAHGPGHTTLYSEMCAACCAYETHQGQIEDICDPWEEPIRNLSSRALINLSSASPPVAGRLQGLEGRRRRGPPDAWFDSCSLRVFLPPLLHARRRALPPTETHPRLSGDSLRKKCFHLIELIE
jgi:hypothetical protein